VTVEPIRPKYFVGTYKIPGKVYGSLKIAYLVRKEYYFKYSANLNRQNSRNTIYNKEKWQLKSDG